MVLSRIPSVLVDGRTQFLTRCCLQKATFTYWLMDGWSVPSGFACPTWQLVSPKSGWQACSWDPSPSLYPVGYKRVTITTCTHERITQRLEYKEAIRNHFIISLSDQPSINLIKNIRSFKATVVTSHSLTIIQITHHDLLTVHFCCSTTCPNVPWGAYVVLELNLSDFLTLKFLAREHRYNNQTEITQKCLN